MQIVASCGERYVVDEGLVSRHGVTLGRVVDIAAGVAYEPAPLADLLAQPEWEPWTGDPNAAWMFPLVTTDLWTQEAKERVMSPAWIRIWSEPGA